MSGRLPSFLIVGAQRSASTFLSTCLNGHPDVFVRHGEVEYFDDPHYGRRGRAYLDHLFDKAPPARVYGFKRPELLSRPECPGRIADELPGVRLIAVLREPIARTVSAYFHYVRLRAAPMLPLNEGLARILDRRSLPQHPMAHEIVDYSLYGAQLRRYMDHFEAASIRTIFDEELSETPKEMLLQTFRFIGVTGEYVDAPLSRPLNVGITCEPRLRFHRAVSPLAFGYNPQFSGIRQNRAAVTAYKALVRLDESILARVYPSDKPALHPAIHARLVEVIRPDLEELSKICGPIPPRWEASLSRSQS